MALLSTLSVTSAPYAVQKHRVLPQGGHIFNGSSPASVCVFLRFLLIRYWSSIIAAVFLIKGI